MIFNTRERPRIPCAPPRLRITSFTRSTTSNVCSAWDACDTREPRELREPTDPAERTDPPRTEPPPIRPPAFDSPGHLPCLPAARRTFCAKCEAWPSLARFVAVTGLASVAARKLGRKRIVMMFLLCTVRESRADALRVVYETSETGRKLRRMVSAPALRLMLRFSAVSTAVDTATAMRSERSEV